MVTSNKIFKEELAKIPKRLLLELIKEKLSSDGLATYPGLAEALTDHCLNGETDVFEWDDGLPSKESPRRLELSFTESDATRLKELADNVYGRLPLIVDEAVGRTAEKLLKTLTCNWPERAGYEANFFISFRERLEARWGKGFDLLRLLLTCCRELGEESIKRSRRSKAKNNLVLRDLILRLHARACQIMAEIITLMENGFADGAMARWRTLYEVGVVATMIAEAGETLANSYIKHEAIESKFAMDEYARCSQALGYRPIPDREHRRIERAFAAAVKAHDNAFGKPYGWAAAYLKKRKVTFRDLEEFVQRSAMRPYYRLASHNVHADTAKSIFRRLGIIGDQSVITYGATNAGFVEPAQNAAITLVQITGLLLADRVSNLNVMTMLRALTMIRDKVPATFIRIDRRLKRDHAKTVRSKSTTKIRRGKEIA